MSILTDLIKFDTPYLGPRIQLMLSQLEFKLSVEKQYKDGIEKMVRLYQDEGDRKSRADADINAVVLSGFALRMHVCSHERGVRHLLQCSSYTTT